MEGWKYYNHAIIPSCAPHEIPDLTPIEDESIFKQNKDALFARWTSNFDCKKATNWWYVIKDTPFDISSLKSKRRYEINKGIKNFEVSIINPLEYKDEIYNVQVAAFSAYPKKYRPTVDKQLFMEEVESWKDNFVIGAFFRETKEFCGYAMLAKAGEKSIDFKVLKTIPQYEKYALNAALVEGVLSFFATFISNGGYICDGARSINHETAFQDYLEKYFGFRKAYCELNIVYNKKIKWLIKLLFPFRKIFLTFDGIGVVHKLNAVLRMEEICREKS